MARKFYAIFIFVLASCIAPVVAEDNIDGLVEAVEKLNIESSESINRMTWEDRVRVRKCLNRIDFIKLDLLAIESAAVGFARKAALSYQPDFRSKKAIKKIINVAIGNANNFHDLFETDLSFFPDELQLSIRRQEQQLQALYYDIQSIQSIEAALDRIEKFHKTLQYFVEVSLFHFLRSIYPQIF